MSKTKENLWEEIDKIINGSDFGLFENSDFFEKEKCEDLPEPPKDLYCECEYPDVVGRFISKTIRYEFCRECKKEWVKK